MSEWINAVQLEEVPEGSCEGVKVKDTPILVSNVEGQFYAINDRCGHMNAPLSLGKFAGHVATCPMHHAAFDVRTGKKLTEPTLGGGLEGMELPQEFVKYMEGMGQLMANIETHDHPTYETRVQDGYVQVKLG